MNIITFPVHSNIRHFNNELQVKYFASYSSVHDLSFHAAFQLNAAEDRISYLTPVHMRFVYDSKALKNERPI